MTKRHWIAWEMRRGGFTNAHLAEYTEQTLCGLAFPKDITNEVENLDKCKACLRENAPTSAEIAVATKRFKAKGGIIKKQKPEVLAPLLAQLGD